MASNIAQYSRFTSDFAPANPQTGPSRPATRDSTQPPNYVITQCLPALQADSALVSLNHDFPLQNEVQRMQSFAVIYIHQIFLLICVHAII